MKLCVNYKSREVNWAADVTYFRSVGVTGVRHHMPAITSPWSDPADSEGNLHWLRRQAKYFSDAGFYVAWGIAGLQGFNGDGQLTATQWTNYRNVILAEAAQLQSLGMTITFEIGNELESKADGTTLTVDQLIINLGTLATDVQAVYTNGPIAYSPWDFNGTTYDKWISHGKGGLDYINVHPYCNTINGRAVSQGAYKACAKMCKAFPGAVDATEFGMEAGASNVLALPTYLKKAKLGELWNYLENIGIGRAFIYSYVGNLNADDDFAMKLNSGQFDPQWSTLINQRKS